MFNCEQKLFLAKVRSFEDQVLLALEVFGVLLRHLLILEYEVANRTNNVILDVLDKSIDERRPNFFDTAFDPLIVVQKVAFACENSQIYRKVVIITANDRYQTIFDLLGNIKYTRQVHQTLIVLTEFTNASDK